jgi:FkbM family methyltransferase
VLKKAKKKFIKKKKVSHAQGGEDMILNTLFSGMKEGQYIDIGANSPFNQSNTAFFYAKGWTGYNIDANPESIEDLNKHRNKDTNILAFVSNTSEVVNYNFFKNSLYNGANNAKEIPSELVKQQEVRSITFDEIAEKYKIKNNVEFLSIDAEGYDLEVLQSIDLNRFQPKAIVIESFDYLIEKSLDNAISDHLKKHNYHYIAKTATNSIYVSDDFYKDRFKVK